MADTPNTASHQTENVTESKQVEAESAQAAENPEDEEPVDAWGAWEEWANEDGVPYYYNTETQESTWKDPRTAKEKFELAKRKREHEDTLRRISLLKKVTERDPTSYDLPTIKTIREEGPMKTLIETMRKTGTGRDRILSVLSDDMDESEEESSDYDENDLTPSDLMKGDGPPNPKQNRSLLRINSAQDWFVDDVKALHDEMREQLEMLTQMAKQQGMQLPNLHKRVPRRPAPSLPPQAKAKQEEEEEGSYSSQGDQAPKKTAVEVVGVKASDPKSKPELNTQQSSASGAPSEDPQAQKLTDRASGSGPVEAMRTPSVSPAPPPTIDEMARYASTPQMLLPKKPTRNDSTRSWASTNSLLRVDSMSVNNLPYQAIADYNPPKKRGSTKISLKAGDDLLIQKKGSTGWWLGKNLRTNKSGYFPGTFVVSGEPLPMPAAGLMQRTASAPQPQPPRPTSKAPKRPPAKVQGMWRGKLRADRSARKAKIQRQRRNTGRNNSIRSVTGPVS